MGLSKGDDESWVDMIMFCCGDNINFSNNHVQGG
jgi:hypothetical protein